MPLYAYIKIPGVGNSESSDSEYGADWIPILATDLEHDANEEDIDYTIKSNITSSVRDKRRSMKKSFRRIYRTLTPDEEKRATELMRARATAAVHAELKPEPEPDDYGLSGLFGEAPPPAPATPPDAPPPKMRSGDPFGDDTCDEAEDSRKSRSGGSITITKILDSTTPQLHKLCLECLQYETSKYIGSESDGTKVEIHICRHVLDEYTSTSITEIYMGYVLENCLITSVKIDASETAKIRESVTITFEKITTSIRGTNKTWVSKGWDFVDEREITGTDPKKPTG